MQVPICNMKTKEKRKCIEGIRVNSGHCLKPCTGFSLTSFLKTKPDKNFDILIPKELMAYQNYVKPHFNFPTGLKGKIFYTCFPYER